MRNETGRLCRKAVSIAIHCRILRARTGDRSPLQSRGRCRLIFGLARSRCCDLSLEGGKGLESMIHDERALATPFFILKENQVSDTLAGECDRTLYYQLQVLHCNPFLPSLHPSPRAVIFYQLVHAYVTYLCWGLWQASRAHYYKIRGRP
jgi:hypothetical protein